MCIIETNTMGFKLEITNSMIGKAQLEQKRSYKHDTPLPRRKRIAQQLLHWPISKHQQQNLPRKRAKINDKSPTTVFQSNISCWKGRLSEVSSSQAPEVSYNKYTLGCGKGIQTRRLTLSMLYTIKWWKNGLPWHVSSYSGEIWWKT